MAYAGDGNNVARSLAYACAKFEMRLDIASPDGYKLEGESIDKANEIRGGSVRQVSDPEEAVEGASVIYTDTWVSMGQEQEKQKRIDDFQGYQVNSELVGKALGEVKIMHCLPAYRGYEITEEVIESEASIVFDQAENRLHFQRALLKKLMSEC
jgi:ornithine carbamoyltransferase